MRGVAVATLAIAIVAGIGIAYSTGTSTTLSTNTTTSSQTTRQSQSPTTSNPGAAPDASQYCRLPTTSTNSSNGFTITMSNPRCGYFTSPVVSRGSVRMVNNETLAVQVQGPPSTAVSLSLSENQFGAAWFLESNTTTDPKGRAGSLLILAGMLVTPQASGNYVKLQAKASGTSGVSLSLPVVENYTVSGLLNSTSPIVVPALVINTASFSRGAYYSPPFGIVYLPPPSSPVRLDLTLSVIGLATGNSTTAGVVQPMPSSLSVWFTDDQGNRISSLTLARSNIAFFFLAGNTTMAMPLNSPWKSYNIAIQVTENGASFTERVPVVIQPPSGPAPKG